MVINTSMRGRTESRGQLVLGLGAIGAFAMVAAAAVAYSVSQRRRRPAYSRLEWARALQEIGTIRGFEEIVDEVADRGIDPSIRPDVWPFLLEVFDYASTYQQRQQQHQLMVRQYQQLLLQCQAYEAALKESLRPATPPAAMSAAAPGTVQQQQQQQQLKSPQQQHQQLQQQYQLPEQVRQFAEAHRIIVIDAVRTDFQKHSAAMASLHDDAGYGSYCSNNGTTAANVAYTGSFAASAGVAAVASLVSQGLNTLQQYWLGSLLGGQAAAWGHQQALWVSEAAQLVLENSHHMVEESKRQASRMIAMLSAYALHDPDTGYCQGMSDLLLPFVLLIDDDALAFWCFVALMQRQGVRRNFAVDESGIFGQLRRLEQVVEANDKPLMFRLHQLGAAECHFAYRMVVVMMRRDMTMGKVMLLWEVLWADAWRQRRLARLAAAAAAAEAGSIHSSSAVPAKDTNSGAAAVGPMELVADSRSDSCKGSSRSESRCEGREELNDSSRFDLFTCFVAAVIISQRRAVLDHCYDADDVLRLFHSMKNVDVWQCLCKAQALQEAMWLQAQQQEQQLQSSAVH